LIGAIAVTLLPDTHRNGLTILTHTVVMGFALAVALYAFIRCLKQPSLASYVFLGLSAAFLTHSKYNSTLFFLLIFPLAQFDRMAAKVIMDRRIFVSILIFIALSLPVVFWSMYNFDQIAATGDKYEFNKGGEGLAGHIYSLWAVMKTSGDSLKYVAVLLLISLALGARWKDRPELLQFLIRYSALFMIVALAAASIAEVGEVKRRWMTPVMFFIAVAVGLWGALNLSAQRRSVLLALLVIFWASRNVLETYDALAIGQKKPGQVTRKFDELVTALKQLAQPGDIIMGPKNEVAQVVLRRPDLNGWYDLIPWPAQTASAKIFLIETAQRKPSLSGKEILKSRLGDTPSLELVGTSEIEHSEHPGYLRQYDIYRVTPESKNPS
jgi:hypothetical protein